MPLSRLILAVSALALTSAAKAQELPLYDASQFGRVIVNMQQSALPAPQYEALIGNGSLELIADYNPASRMARLGRAVGKLDILTDLGGYAPCTAFLVAGNKLVTNHHCVPGVLDHPKMKGNVIAAVQFHAGFTRDGIRSDVTTFQVSPVPLETNKDLDYSVLQVIGEANAEFGALELSAELPRDADPLFVIGHPQGWAQRLSREKCQTSVPAVEGNRVRHSCDTMPGNSGSPVFDDDRRQVVALHSAASGPVNLAVPMAQILAQSKVLKAVAPVVDEGDKLAALQEELDRLRKEREAEKAAAEAERKRLADEAAKKAEAERKRLADERAALKAERERLAKEKAEADRLAKAAEEKRKTDVATAKPFVAEAPNSARFPGRYWEKTTLMLSGHSFFVNSSAFSPDGALIVTASLDETARVWNASTGHELARLVGHASWVNSAVFSSDGTRIATTSHDKTVGVWDAMTGRELTWLFGHEERVYWAAFSPDGTRIVTASSDKTARVWDVKTGKELVRLSGHGDLVFSADFSPDGMRIVTASADKTARVWDARSGALLSTQSGHDSWVRGAAFSPDGRRIVTAYSDGVALVWDSQTGQELVRLSGHEDIVNKAAFSPDGTRIVTASSDMTARVWDARTGQELAKLSGHESNVNTAVFSPDGTQILTASHDETARIWGGF